MQNRGLVIPKIETREDGAEHLLGSIEKFRGTAINLKGDWRPFLPTGELQNKGLFEPTACASFGTNNAVETLKNFLEKTTDANFSDRALAIGSGTDPKVGNDPHKVAEYARNTLGFAPESTLPYDETITTLDKFYSPKPLTKDIIASGNTFFNQYEFAHEWVFTDGDVASKKQKLKIALQKGTVCVSVYAWQRNGTTYVKPAGATDNHWVQLVAYDGENPIIFDSYAEADNTPYLKTLDPLYDFGMAKVYYLSPAQPRLDWFQSIIDFIKNIVMPQLKKQVDTIAPIVPDQSLPPKAPEVTPKYLWDNPTNARHSVRVICDEEGLLGLFLDGYHMKDALCWCVAEESGFNPKAIGKVNKDGTKDWGIAQFNDGKNSQGVPYWIGQGALFASTDEVLQNPEKSIREMAKLFKAGKATLWASFNNKSYKSHL